METRQTLEQSLIDSKNRIDHFTEISLDTDYSKELSHHDFLELPIQEEDYEPTESLPLPSNFPVQTKYIKQFQKKIDQSEIASQKNKPFHPIYRAIKQQDSFYIKQNTPASNNADDIIKAETLSCLEVANWSQYKIVCPDIVTDEMYTCYDENYQINAVASKNLAKFTPNRFDPLQQKNLVIGALDGDFGYQRHCLLSYLTALSNSLARKTPDYVSSSKEKIKYYLHSFWNPNGGPAAAELKPIIDKYIELKTNLTQNTVNTELTPSLQKRKNHIETLLISYHTELTTHSTDYNNIKNQLEDEKIDPSIKDKLKTDLKRITAEMGEKEKFIAQYKNEKKLLNDAIASATRFVSINLANKSDIKPLEETDRAVKALEKKLIRDYAAAKNNQKITIDFFGRSLLVTVNDLKNGGLLDKLNEEEKISHQSYSISIKDLKNYRTAKGQAEGITTSYANGENDLHNKNISKNGKRVDFDMSEWFFLSLFKDINFSDWFQKNTAHLLESVGWKKPAEDPFVFTEYDIEHLPNIKNVPFRYFPTKAAVLEASNLVVVPFYENFFTSNDNLVFKELEGHPVFDFHKWKTFLKICLIPDEIIKESIALCIRKDLTYKDKNREERNLLEAYTTYKINRNNTLRNQLLKMPAFRKFLTENGAYALDLIKRDFAEDLADYEFKDKEHYNELKNCYSALVHASPEVNKLDQTYNTILETLNNNCEAISNQPRSISPSKFPVSNLVSSIFGAPNTTDVKPVETKPNLLRPPSPVKH